MSHSAYPSPPNRLLFFSLCFNPEIFCGLLLQVYRTSARFFVLLVFCICMVLRISFKDSCRQIEIREPVLKINSLHRLCMKQHMITYQCMCKKKNWKYPFFKLWRAVMDLLVLLSIEFNICFPLETFFVNIYIKSMFFRFLLS